MSNLYSRLGLTAEATTGQIKKAFRKLSKKHHPDVNGGVENEDWHSIKEAYDILSDPSLRAEYDRTGDIPSGVSQPSEEELIRAASVQRVLELFTSIISSWEEDEEQLLHLDPFDLIRDKIAEAKVTSSDFQRKMNIILTNLNLFRTFCLKDNSDTGLFVSCLNTRIDGTMRAIANAKREDKIMELAETLMENVEFCERVVGSIGSEGDMDANDYAEVG